MNKVFLIGNLTKDPELLDLEAGVKLAKFTLATNKNWQNKDGEKVASTDFHNIVAWRKLAEICAAYLKKGSAVMVEGKISQNKYQGKDGKNKIATEIYADEVHFITTKKTNEMEEINLVEVAA